MYEKGTYRQVAPSRQGPNWKEVDQNFKPDNNLREMVQRKKKMASWLVSNCDDDPSERMKLVKSLQKFIPVDIYGKCGQPCQDCDGQLAADYFFYLAFENSLAKDYITEKTYNFLGKGIIPVVYGGADYSKFLPPKSYIEAQKFKTTKDLAEFLTALSQNTEEYLSYFWWTEHYWSTIGQGYVDLCGELKSFRRGIGSKVQYYQDLEVWEHRDTWINRTIQFS